MQLNDHYRLLLGLDEHWRVRDVKLNLAERRVDIYLEHADKGDVCPACGEPCPLYDHAPERQWRHLDTMQFQTVIHASPPRIKCGEHGVRTASVPWAGPHSRFTLLFEAFAIEVIRACRNTKDAADLLRLDWHSVLQIMRRAVQRGLWRRDGGEIAWVGLDEKSFGKGHDYISVMTDIEGNRVLDVVSGRSAESASELIGLALDPIQQEMVCGVAMDMSAPFEKAVRENLPNADIVADKFHVEKLLGEAVDKVRRQENAILLKRHDKRLKKTKYLWLTGMEHLSPENLARLEDLRKQSLMVANAWRIKYSFSFFWTRRNRAFAKMFFKRWHQDALATKLKPVVKAAETLRRHLEHLLNYFECYITNAISEGFNSKIQAIKANARGFRNFVNYRTAILFFCGRLDMSPLSSSLFAPCH